MESTIPSAKRFGIVRSHDARCNGIFQLITNCRDLSIAKLLEAYKHQPTLEKRHEVQVCEIAPM